MASTDLLDSQIILRAVISVIIHWSERKVVSGSFDEREESLPRILECNQ
jgi:hypothetical protein